MLFSPFGEKTLMPTFRATQGRFLYRLAGQTQTP